MILRSVLLLSLSVPVWAGAPEVVDVVIGAAGDGTYRFDVTVRHEDEGWDHYADRFEVLNDEGVVLGTRVLHHPHENEQPFTRSLSGVQIDTELDEVRVRAHDSVHGYGEDEMRVSVPR